MRTERALYLRRPDLRPAAVAGIARALLRARGRHGCDLALVIGDGLSAAAVHAHAVPLVAAFLPHAEALELSLGPVVIAHGARVALGDEIGALLRRPRWSSC